MMTQGRDSPGDLRRLSAVLRGARATGRRVERLIRPSSVSKEGPDFRALQSCDIFRETPDALRVDAIKVEQPIRDHGVNPDSVPFADQVLNGVEAA